MGTYKVIQDIEAEDKLLGPLSLRQFIYAIIVVVSGVAIFKLLLVKWWLIFPLLPHTILFAVLAAPFGHDQPSEVWLLAKIRFFLKPRKRIWDQSGLKELVTITAPKKVEKVFVKNFSQDEVKSRLQALANTIDSRGWAVKNVNVNLFSQPSYVMGQVGSDRLIDPSTIAQDVNSDEVNSADDILDERNNPTAQLFNQMIQTKEQTRREEIVQRMHDPNAATPGQATPPPNYWFMNEPPAPTDPNLAAFGAQIVQPGQGNDPYRGMTSTAPDEQALLQSIQSKKVKQSAAYGNLKTINPLGQGPEAKAEVAPEKAQATSTPPPNPAILELANNDDLNVATIARQAEKATKGQLSDDEVVISLH
jgi:hypothetical protein